MEIRRIPRITPSSTSVWFDFEGVLAKNNISFYLFQYNPKLFFKSIIEGLIQASCNKIRDWRKELRKELIMECKRLYESELGPTQLYELGKWTFKLQPEEHKRSLMDLLKLLKKDGYDMYIVSSASKRIVYGFLRSLPRELNFEQENVFASEDKFLDGYEKMMVIESIKNRSKKKIIGVGDSSNDEMALEKSDVACVISSPSHKLMPCKTIKPYIFKDLASLKCFFDAISTDYNQAFSNYTDLKIKV